MTQHERLLCKKYIYMTQKGIYKKTTRLFEHC